MTTETELPARAGDTISFTPACAQRRDPPPVYKLRVPSLMQRAAIDRDLTLRGATPPDFRQSLSVMRAAIGAVMSDDLAGEARAVVEDFEAAVLQRKVDVDFVGIHAAFTAIETEMIARHPGYAAVAAQKRYHYSLQQIVTLQHLLVGWSKTGHAPADFERADGLTSERTLSLIPADEYAELVLKAAELTHLTQAQSKNSAPPASSSSSPNATQAAPTTETSGLTTGS